MTFVLPAGRKWLTVTVDVPSTKDYDVKPYYSGTLVASSLNDLGIDETITYENPSSSYNRTYFIKLYGYNGDCSNTYNYVIKDSW